MKILFFLLIIKNISAMTFEEENILKLSLMSDKKTYEVVIKNKAAFYKADVKLIKCLQKGIKEKVKLEVDPMKLIILNCE